MIGNPDRFKRPKKLVTGSPIIEFNKVASSVVATNLDDNISKEIDKQNMLMDYLHDNVSLAFAAIGNMMDAALHDELGDQGDILIDDHNPEVLEALNCPCCNPNYNDSTDTIGFANIRSAEKILTEFQTSKIKALREGIAHCLENNEDPTSLINNDIASEISSQVSGMWKKLMVKVIYSVTVKPINSITCGTLAKIRILNIRPFQFLCKECQKEIAAQEFANPWLKNDPDFKNDYGKYSGKFKNDPNLKQLASKYNISDSGCTGNCPTHAALILNHATKNSNHRLKVLMHMRAHLKHTYELYRKTKLLEHATRPVKLNKSAFYNVYGKNNDQSFKENPDPERTMSKEEFIKEMAEKFGSLVGGEGYKAEDFGPGGKLDPTTYWMEQGKNSWTEANYWSEAKEKIGQNLKDKGFDDKWHQAKRSFEDWWKEGTQKFQPGQYDSQKQFASYMDKKMEDLRQQYGSNDSLSSYGSDLANGLQTPFTRDYWSSNIDDYIKVEKTADLSALKANWANGLGFKDGIQRVWEDYKKGFVGTDTHSVLSTMVGEFWSNYGTGKEDIFNQLLNVNVDQMMLSAIGPIEMLKYKHIKNNGWYGLKRYVPLTHGNVWQYYMKFLWTYMKSFRWMESQFVCCLLAFFVSLSISPKVQKFLLLILAIIQLIKESFSLDLFEAIDNFLNILKTMYNDVMDAIFEFIAGVIETFVAALVKLLQDLFKKLPYLQCFGIIQILALLLKELQKLLKKLMDMLKDMLKHLMGDSSMIRAPIEAGIKSNILDMLERLILAILAALRKLQLCSKHDKTKIEINEQLAPAGVYSPNKFSSVKQRVTKRKRRDEGKRKSWFKKRKDNHLDPFRGIDPENYSLRPTQPELINFLSNYLSMTDPQIELFLHRAGGYEGCVGVVDNAQMEEFANIIVDYLK